MDYEEVYEFGKAETYRLDNGTVTGWSSSGTSTTPLCGSCQQSPCVCMTTVTAPSVFLPNAPTFSIGTDLEQKLSICQVCGAEESFVLCEVCVEAVKLARNRWLDEFRAEIDEFLDE